MAVIPLVIGSLCWTLLLPEGNLMTRRQAPPRYSLPAVHRRLSATVHSPNEWHVNKRFYKG